jgi:hypothetical protein
MATALELRPEATPDELEAAWQRFKEQRAFAHAKQEREYLLFQRQQGHSSRTRFAAGYETRRYRS